MAETPVGRALEALGAVGDCPSCRGANQGHWLGHPEGAELTFTLNTIEPIDIRALICPTCGYVRLHAASFLTDEYLQQRADHDASG